MLTTIASLLTGRSVPSKLAMTGEVTLRGAVMPVGGIKEKVVAAHRAGIERIIMSKRNQKDLREVPDEVKAALRFEFVDTAAKVLKLALGLDASIQIPMGGSGEVAPPPAGPCTIGAYEEFPPWIRSERGGLVLLLYVQPGAFSDRDGGRSPRGPAALEATGRGSTCRWSGQ